MYIVVFIGSPVLLGGSLPCLLVAVCAAKGLGRAGRSELTNRSGDVPGTLIMVPFLLYCGINFPFSRVARQFIILLFLEFQLSAKCERAHRHVFDIVYNY